MGAIEACRATECFASRLICLGHTVPSSCCRCEREGSQHPSGDALDNIRGCRKAEMWHAKKGYGCQGPPVTERACSSVSQTAHTTELHRCTDGPLSRPENRHLSRLLRGSISNRALLELNLPTQEHLSIQLSCPEVNRVGEL